MMDKETSIGKSTVSTFVVMICTMVSRILGFARTAVVTAIFGASGAADVINLTFAVPNNLRKLMAEGALSSAFIPVLSETLVEKPDGTESKSIVRSILTFQLILLVPLSVLCIVFARPLIAVVLAEFSEEWQVTLSAGLFRWFINYLLLISISAVLMAVLNSHNRFFVPALTPILFSVSVIGSILLLHGRLGEYSMAVGVLAGGLAQILFQTPSFMRLGYRFRPNFDFSSPRFRKVLRQWLPVLATSSIYTITETVAFRFSSGLAPGSASAMSNALVFWQLPFGIFSPPSPRFFFPA
jgi:putative peptidoglycan lipid II flippase